MKLWKRVCLGLLGVDNRIADAYDAYGGLSSQLVRTEAERDALRVAIEAAQTRLRLHLSEVEGCERAGGMPGLVGSGDLRQIIAVLDTSNTPAVNQDHRHSEA